MRKILVVTFTLLMGIAVCSLNSLSLPMTLPPANIDFTSTTGSHSNFGAQNQFIKETSILNAGDTTNASDGKTIDIPIAFNNYPPSGGRFTPTPTMGITLTKTITMTSTPKPTMGITLTKTTTMTSTPKPTSITTSFSFVTLSDAQDDGAVLPDTANQASALNPNFGIFIGDLESDGVTQTQMNAETSALGSLYPKMLFVRGNHDNHYDQSMTLWESYFAIANRPLPAGVSNLTALDSNSTYLNYSFDYGNSRFIGLDVPGDADLLTSSELSFLDTRLTDAESKGLVHTFIFFHGPPYCTESTHCSCTKKSDSSCTPSAFITIINKHPIVDATFDGHEHLLAWTHMDNTRVANLTHPYEQFLTAPSGTGNYNQYLYPKRVDYVNLQNAMAFGSITVNGTSFTVNFYRVGTTAPVWVKTFNK